VEEVVVQAPVPETAGEKPVAQLAHTAELVAPVTLENVLAAQSVHTAAPVAILYLPATQAVHTPPSGHPVTCSSAKCKKFPFIEICRYRPRSGVAHVTSAM
jgi:hypothetical protein